MTISVDLNRNDYVSIAGQRVFPYTFKIFGEGDLDVYVNGVLKILTTDYLVSGVGWDAGGNVSLNVALSDGDRVAIIRTMDNIQGTDYVDGQNLAAATLENDFDKMVILIQQLKEKLDRALKFANHSLQKNIAFPEPAAGKYIVWNASGTGISSADAIDAGVTSSPTFSDLTVTAATVLNSATIAGLTVSAINAVDVTVTGALYLNPAIIAAPFVVGSNGYLQHVIGLNADALDGFHATDIFAAAAQGLKPRYLYIRYSTDAQLLIDVANVFIQDVYKTGITSLVMDLSVAGAGGREAADSEASDTWYYIWLIAMADGTVNSYASKTSTPTLPAGYTRSRFIGCWRNDGSSNLVKAIQTGEDFHYYDYFYVLSAGDADRWTNISLSAYVPPPVKEVDITCLMVSSVTASQFAQVCANTVRTAADQSGILVAQSGAAEICNSTFRMQVINQSIDYRILGQVDATLSIALHGFKVEI